MWARQGGGVDQKFKFWISKQSYLPPSLPPSLLSFLPCQIVTCQYDLFWEEVFAGGIILGTVRK